MDPNKEDVMISDDNVVEIQNISFLRLWIPFRDSIKSIDALVKWMTREKRFYPE